PPLEREGDSYFSYLNETLRRVRKRAILPSSIVTSSLTTSATRGSRRLPAAVCTALRAASSQDSALTPMMSVTRYTLSAICSSFRSNGGRRYHCRAQVPRWSGPSCQRPGPRPGLPSAPSDDCQSSLSAGRTVMLPLLPDPTARA